MPLMKLNGQTDYKLIDGLIIFPKTGAVHREEGKPLGFLPKGTEAYPNTAAEIQDMLVDENGKKIKKEDKQNKSQLEQIEDVVTAHPHEIKLQKEKINDQREKTGQPSLEEEAEELKKKPGKSEKEADKAEDEDEAKGHKKK